MLNSQRDAQYELLVRGAANAYFAPELRAQVEAGLATQGYVVDRVFDSDANGTPNNTTSTTFRGLGLRSQDGSKPPVLIMPGGFAGDEFAVFQANKQSIRDWLSGITTDKQHNPQGFKPDITGGSLGGVFTQWIASEFPTLIGAAVSFAASGISRDGLRQFIANGGKPQQITHYIVDGDYRSLTGEAFLPGEAIVSNFSTPFDEKITEVKHQSLFFNEPDKIRKFLSVPDDAPRGLATLPPDRIFSNLSVKELNRSDFTFSGQDWQRLLAAFRTYNPNLAELVSNRQNFDEFITNSTLDAPSLQILLSDVVHGKNPVPSELIDRPTDGNDILFGNDRQDKISGLAGDDYIRGSNGNDTLFGDAGKDSLIGGKGNDILAGGVGDDVLTGGVGKNRFVFGNDTPFANLGIDRLTDFMPNEDRIELSNSAFSTLGTDFFSTVTNDAAAATSMGSIVYNTTNGKLFYNPDGNMDGFGSGGQFANLTNAPTLSAQDFTI